MAGRTRVAVTFEQSWHRVPGGTARAAIETMAAMLVNHPEVDLIGVSARHRDQPVPPFVPPMPVTALPLPRRALYDSWHRLRRPRVERATGPVDIIHATGLAMPPASAPIVWTLHDVAWRRDPSTFTKRGVKFFEAALELAKKDAALVLCSSQATMDDAAEAGLPADRLRLVPLGVRMPPTSTFQMDGVRTRAKRGGGPAPSDAGAALRRTHGLDRPYVLSVGTAEPRKNLGALVAAMAELGRADVDLVLVGPDGWHEELDTLTAPLGDRARRLGFVSDADLNLLYAGAAAFAYPSRWEGFGLPVLEAMAHGSPVVTSVGTACAEVAGDAALLVDPDDTSALAAAIARLLDDPEEADRLRELGLARARQFSWDRTANLTVAAYREARRR